jgi:hypothetical protein
LRNLLIVHKSMSCALYIMRLMVYKRGEKVG